MYLEVSKHDNVHSRYILLSFICDKGVYFYNLNTLSYHAHVLFSAAIPTKDYEICFGWAVSKWRVLISFQLATYLQFYHKKQTKGSDHLAHSLADFWVPNEIDRLNFQHMLLFWFPEASQNFSLFRQLFFHSFQGGPKEKCWKTNV